VTASDPAGLTAVPGVWVAGNVTDIQAQVITAAAQGLAAAAAVNADLIAEETRRAVDASRAHRLARDPAGSAQRAG
jgi:alkyl hydroperoxide reductase subunit AhpF